VVLLAALFAALRLGGYAALPTNPSPHAASALDQVAAASTSPPVTPNHSSFYGLGEFLRRWEINDLLFSIVYENLRPVSDGQQSPAQTWYVFTPAGTRERANRVLQSVARNASPELVRLNLPFLFTQTLMAAIMLGLTASLALKCWPEDDRPELLRRAIFWLAWLWFLSATQNPWYWSWALPLVLFASRPWLLVSGLASLYYLRFWFIYRFPEPTLLSGLNGQRFFDEVVVWLEHLPGLMMLAGVYLYRWHTSRSALMCSRNHPNPDRAVQRRL